MKTIVLPVPPGVRIGGTKTTVQIPVDTPTEPSSNTTRKRFLTLLRDGSGFCKYPKAFCMGSGQILYNTASI